MSYLFESLQALTHSGFLVLHIPTNWLFTLLNSLKLERISYEFLGCLESHWASHGEGAGQWKKHEFQSHVGLD